MGSKGRFRHLDDRGRRITDEAALERIRSLAIPPAWTDVRIAAGARAKVQATGYDAAGRKQYRYHPDYRARREQEKFDRLIQFAERLPTLRAAMAEHMELEGVPVEKVAAIAVRLINHGWFRVGGEQYAKRSRTFGITTLRKSHVDVRGSTISFRYRGKHRVMVRTAVVDEELARAVRDLLELPGTRLFQVEIDGELHKLGARRLNDYIREHLGEAFTAKDFRTWGGTLIAAISFAEQEPPESDAQARRRVAAVMREVGEMLGNTPAVARSSYVSPAVVEQYLDGRTIDDFRPRHLRVVVRELSSSLPRSGPRSRCFAPGEFARRASCICVNCRSLRNTSNGGEIGSENRPGLRQLRQGGRRGTGRALRVTYSDARRGSKSGGSLRRLRGQDARSRSRAAAAAGRSRRPRVEPTGFPPSGPAGRGRRPAAASTMARWDCPSSQGPRTRARSRSCSSAIWRASRTSRS